MPTTAYCTPHGALDRNATSLSPPPALHQTPAARRSLRRSSCKPLEQPTGLVAPLRSIQKVLGPMGNPGREGQPWRWPAGRPFWCDPVRRPPPPVTSGLRSPLACGNPVPHRPAVQPGMGRPCLAPAGRPIGGDPALRRPQVLHHRHPLLAITSQLASVTLERSPLSRGGKKNPTGPRRRRPERLRVTLTLSAGQPFAGHLALGRIRPYTRDLGPAFSDPTMSGGPA